MGDRSVGMVSLSGNAMIHRAIRILAETPNTTPSQPLGPNFTARFNPSMVIIIIVLISAFLFMGFFSIYVRRCTRGNDTANVNTARQTHRDAANTRLSQGLDKSVVEALPLVGYSLVKGLKGGKEISECAVCLSEFEDDENLRLLPKCGHIFHPDCIDMWFHSHTTCPLCRSSLVQSEGKKVDGEEQNHSEESQNWITSRGIGPDGEAFTIHEGPPVPPNGSILELLSRDGVESMLAESVRITGERAERLDAGLARREGEDDNAKRAAGLRALNRALSKNSASFRNAARGSDANFRIEAVTSGSAFFNSASVSVGIPDRNEVGDRDKPGSRSFNASHSIDLGLRRSSSVGSSGRYIKQVLGKQGYSNFSPDEFKLDRSRLLNSQQELPIVNPIIRRERSASELRNIVIPTWQDIDFNDPTSGGERGVNGTGLVSPTTRPGELPFERWASRNRKFRSGELSGNNFDGKRGAPSGDFHSPRSQKDQAIEERTILDRWSSFGQSFRRTFTLKRTMSNTSDVESPFQQQQGNSKTAHNVQTAQPGSSSASKPKKFSPWAGASKSRRQPAKSGELLSPGSPSPIPFRHSLSASDFPQSLRVDSPRSLPADSVASAQSLHAPNEQQHRHEQRHPPKEDSTQSEMQP